VTYSRYRAIASEEQKRERNRERIQRFRENGGGAPDRWPAIRARILKLDNHVCGYCEKEANEVDHIIPQSRGGDESDENLTACCRSCNVEKNNRTPEEAGFTLKNHRVTLASHPVTLDPPSNAKQNQMEKQMQRNKTELPEVIEIYNAYPRKVGRPVAIRAIIKALETMSAPELLEKTKAYALARAGADQQYTPHPSTWFNQQRFNDHPATWKPAQPTIPGKPVEKSIIQKDIEASSRWIEKFCKEPIP
jgi:5-methylcytosine-specific restriction endonuclease McrA